ncbi:MAG: hypothetical protein ACRD1X_12490 [Vicinamibacteria bacterium]
MKVTFRIVLGRIAHAAIGRRPETLCGRILKRHPEVKDLTARKAYLRADCRKCRASFHPDVKRGRTP